MPRSRQISKFHALHTWRNILALWRDGIITASFILCNVIPSYFVCNSNADFWQSLRVESLLDFKRTLTYELWVIEFIDLLIYASQFYYFICPYMKLRSCYCKGTTFCITFCIILHNFCIIAISLCKSLGGPSDGSEASHFLPPILHNHYAKVMQKLCKRYAKVMQKLCKVMQSYAKLCKAKIC